jgi:metal-responsive CopG/Arc/MetJ family transcriptional regulator
MAPMSTPSPRIPLSITVPADMLKRIDSAAQAQTRSRSQQINHLLRLALGETSVGTEAANAHLREHARLAGFPDTNPEED